MKPEERVPRHNNNNNEEIDNNNDNNNNDNDNNNNSYKKKIRRSKKKNSVESMTIVYANIQGLTKKKESLAVILEELECDVCLLAETMVCKAKVDGARCITASKSVGQNVCIIVRKTVMNNKIVKLYDPNEIANMIGIRVDMVYNSLRIYTAHLKQQSTNTRDEIKDQFEEVRKQFQNATCSNESIVMVFDANVHVGDTCIKGCPDKQDWGGKLLMQIVEEENLIVLNMEDICTGVITRIDQRNGKGSTIDYAICNQFFVSKVSKMTIDEEGRYKPTNYANGKKTDHNTIVLDLKFEKSHQGRKPVPYTNLNNEKGREIFKNYLMDADVENLIKNGMNSNVNNEYKRFCDIWDGGIKASFKKTYPKGPSMKGITKEIRDLMKEEKWIRENIVENPERGRRIAETKKKIKNAVERSRSDEMIEKVNMIRSAKNPAGEIYKIRRDEKKSERVGFPLKDGDGILQVTKEGVHGVIDAHFKRVFMQNPVPSGEVWVNYWALIDKVCENIENEGEDGKYEEPTVDEIKTILNKTNDKKAVRGDIKSGLLKLGGEPIVDWITRFIVLCCEKEMIPDEMKIERMTILYKNKGSLADIDNYRGIFIRIIILSILQKWMYTKCSTTVDESGSEFAFGGRKERSGKECLLILRLMQDHSNWSKQPMILKFLDVTKFFDTMNFKKCLIEAYKSGITGKYWRMYKATNEVKVCSPTTPLGQCEKIDVSQVFLQGSSDAMLMAWNMVDALNKKESDVCDPVFVVEGVIIPGITFVDDSLEAIRNVEDLKTSMISNECFERANRVYYKPVKCKLMFINCDEVHVFLDGVKLDGVDEHGYLGTIVEKNGRKADLMKRVSDCKGGLE